jgi:hypothetical protein
MWTERRFHQAIDRHVQGIGHPFAPWNQDDGLLPMCDNCEVDPCNESCAEFNEEMRKIYIQQKLEDNNHYMAWLGEYSEETVLELSEENILDWIALDNLSKFFHDYRLDAEGYLNA